MKKRNIAILVALFVGAFSLNGRVLIDGAKDQLTDKLEFLDSEKRKNKRRIFFSDRAYEKKISGDYKGAIKDYKKALEIDPSYISASFWYYQIAYIKEEKFKDYYGAIADITKAISKEKENNLNRRSHRFYKKRGLIKIKVGDYQGAIEDHTKEIELLGNYSYKYIIAKAYAARALNKEKLNDYQGAINDYTNAIELNPTDWAGKDGNLLYKYYSYRASLKIKLKYYLGAIEDFDYVINNELTQNDKKTLAFAYTNRGIAKAEIKDYAGAILDQKKAIKLYPYSNGSNQSNISKTYYLAGDMESSCMHLRNATYLGHKDAIRILNSSKGKEICKSTVEKKKQSDLACEEKYYESAMQKVKTGQFELAILDFSSVVNCNPKNGNAYFNMGNAFRDLKDYSGAIYNYTKAIKINPNDYEAYNNRGKAKSNLKDYLGAISDYKKAVEINPNFDDVYLKSGSLKLFNLKDYEGAITDFTFAIEINPKNTNLYFLRALAKEKAGDLKSACSDAKKAKLMGNFDIRNQGFIDRVCK